MKNDPNNFDSTDLQARAEALIQEAEENGTSARIDWNSSASLKFSSVTIIMALFSAYMIELFWLVLLMILI